MVDSVIAGTGNSRYLRTSLSSSTTWEEALTMLRAGTFPIDLAGINQAGFTTLGTALNSATLLKSAVITALGLSADATPSDAWEAVITLINDKADEDSVVTAVAYNSNTKELTATINGTATVVATFDFVNATEAATAAPVQSVAGKTGNVTLDGGDISYNDAATYSSGSVGAEVADLKSAIGDVGENILAVYPTDTASGAAASFPDGAAVPVKSLVADIVPVQNLNGYDNPWPAGGGKNKLPTSPTETINNVKFTLDADGGYSFSGTATANAAKDIGRNSWSLPAGTYTLSASGTYNAVFSVFKIVGGTATLLQDGTGTFTLTESTSLFVRMFFASGTTASGKAYVQVESGSSPTSFAPYSNVCPISGHTGVTVYDDAYYGGMIDWNQKAPTLNTTNWKKVNTATWVTFTAADGTATVAIAGDKTSNTHIYPSTTPDVAGHVVYIRMDAKCTNPQSNQRATVLFFQNASISQTLISSAVSADWSTYETVATITVTAQQTRFYVSTGSNSDFSYYIKNPQIIDLTQMFGPGNEPTTLEAFHALFPAGEYAYSAGTETTVGAVRNDPGWNVSITFPTPPGTVYGGTLDVTTGVLTVDRRYTTVGNENVTTVSGSNYSNFQITLASGYKSKNASSEIVSISSAFKGYSFNAAPSSGDNYVFATAGNLRIKNTANAALGADEWKALMASVELCYLLATPTTYQLTPTEVSTLLGANNIWADTGDTTVNYRADTTLYIDKLTGSTEEDMIADAPIASGKYFLVGNRLFLSTTSIAAGATLTPGTNCVETNLAAALNAINS